MITAPHGRAPSRRLLCLLRLPQGRVMDGR